MKRILYALALVSLITTSASAAVFTVSNMTPSPGQYLTIDAAIAAASAGDTVYVQGSTFNYLTATLNKKLTLIGTGHHVPNQSPLTSDIDNLYFGAGSTGSTLIGLNLYYVTNNTSAIDSVTITRCRVRYQIRFTYACSHWTLDGNLFEYAGNCLFGQNQDLDYLVIKNNIINGLVQDFNYYGNCTNLTAANNIFLNVNYAFITFNYAYLYNNIFYRANPSSNVTGNTWSNNLSYQCGNNSFPNGVNQAGVNPMFVNFPGTGGYFDYSYDFHLQPGSPAIAAGNDGLDLGVYGGVGNFEQNGIPAIPQLRAFNITSPTTVAPGATLNISIISTIRQ